MKEQKNHERQVYGLDASNKTSSTANRINCLLAHMIPAYPTTGVPDFVFVFFFLVFFCCFFFDKIKLLIFVNTLAVVPYEVIHSENQSSNLEQGRDEKG